MEITSIRVDRSQMGPVKNTTPQAELNSQKLSKEEQRNKIQPINTMDRDG